MTITVGTTGKLSGAALKNSYPISMVGWFGGPTFPVSSASCLTQSGTTGGSNNGGGILRAYLANNASKHAQDYALGWGGVSADRAGAAPDYSNQLRLFVVVFESASSRKVYFGGSTPSVNTDLMQHPSISDHTLFTIAGDLPANAQVAEVHVYGIALTDADVASMLSGTLGETVPGWIDGWKLKDLESSGNYVSISGARALTATGTVSAGALAHPVTRTAAPPVIGTQPSNQTAVAGAVATLTGAATGTGTLTYQWQRSTNGGGSWANVGGTNTGATTSYSTPATSVTGGSANNGDKYRFTVTDGTSITTSSDATLTVNLVAATSVTLAGPTVGGVGSASSVFTVSANGAITGTITATPSDEGGGGTFAPTSVQISAGTPSATFTYTAASAGAKTISVANSGGLDAPANISFAASTAAATTVALTLTTDGATPAASLTGLKWAFFDQPQPSNFAAPVAKSTAGITNAAGLLSLSIAGTALAPGAVGFLIVSNTDGTATSAANVFAGPVVVS